MRTPVELIWQLIGDVFPRTFQDPNDRRWVEAMWQGMTDLAAESIDIVDHFRRLKNIYEADVYTPYKTISVDPLQIESPLSMEGRLIGGRLDENDDWSWDVYNELGASTPSHGHITLSSTSLEYDERESISLMSGGTITNVKLPAKSRGVDAHDAWELDESAPSSFSLHTDLTGDKRWVDDGSGPITKEGEGLRLNPASDTSTLSDAQWFDGAHDWRQVWRLQVDNWPDNGQDRYISVLSEGYEDDFEVRLYQDGQDIKVGYGDFGAGLQDMSGDMTGWKFDLVNKSGNEVEIVLEYDSVAGEIHSEFWLNGESVSQPSGYSVKHGPRKHHFEVHSSQNKLDALLKNLVVPEGGLWNVQPAFGDEARISTQYGNVYQIDPPIVGCDGIQVGGPWKLLPRASLTKQTSTTLTAELGEEWNEYAPEYARIDHGDEDFLILELSGQDGRDVEYEITYQTSPSIDLPGAITIKPWYIDGDKVTWVTPGQFHTDIPLPSGDVKVWLEEAEGRDVGLHERFGRLLDVPEREDSPEYMAVLRGMHYALHSNSTPDDTLKAVNMTVGLPYAKKAGIVREIERVTNDFGKPLYDLVTVGQYQYRLHPKWNDQDRLVTEGAYLRHLDSLVHGASIEDWVTDPDLLEDLVGFWEMWGTFVVMVDGTIGLTEQNLKDVHRLMRKSKDKRKNYVVFQMTETVEDRTNHIDDAYFPENTAHAISDMIFDAHSTVINNDIQSAEEDPPGDQTTLGGESMGVGPNAAESWLRRINPYRITIGHSLNEDILSKYEVGTSTVDLMREVESAGVDIGRAHMRMAPDVVVDPDTLNDIYAAWPQPYTLLAVYDGSTDNLAPQTVISPTEVLGGAQNMIALDMPAPHQVRAVGEQGTLVETDDYGNSWSTRSTPNSNALVDIDGRWVVGHSATLLWRNGLGSWVAKSGPDTDDFSLIQRVGGTLWLATEDPSVASYNIYRSDDDAGTWSSSLLANTLDVYDMSFATSEVGWVADGNALRLTDDDGSSWSTFESGGAWHGVHALDEDTAWACGSSGVVAKTEDAGQNWAYYTVSSTTYDYTDIHFFDDRFGMVITTGSKIFHTVDGGESWVEQSVAQNLTECFHSAKIFRAATADNGAIYIWK